MDAGRKTMCLGSFKILRCLEKQINTSTTDLASVALDKSLLLLISYAVCAL